TAERRHTNVSAASAALLALVGEQFGRCRSAAKRRRSARCQPAPQSASRQGGRQAAKTYIYLSNKTCRRFRGPLGSLLPCRVRCGRTLATFQSIHRPSKDVRRPATPITAWWLARRS